MSVAFWLEFTLHFPLAQQGVDAYLITGITVLSIDAV